MNKAELRKVCGEAYGSLYYNGFLNDKEAKSISKKLMTRFKNEDAPRTEDQRTSQNSESVKLPSETLTLSKCSFFDKCPATGKGHAGCYSEAPCFGQ